jgi:hypothetical protein
MQRQKENKMSKTTAIRSLLFSLILMVFSHGAFAQIRVGISVGFGPPAIPVYDQPVCPGDGYLWTPGFWDYDDEDGYYWVPGTWVEAPEVGYLWTPGYWGWGGSAFVFHEGYWGPHVGFYGGINYGFGYGGEGYEGGRWEGEHFSYNTYVNHVNTTVIHNTYNTRVVNITENHVSYNGGNGGIDRRPSSQEEAYSNERHVGRVEAQQQHIQQARGNPELRASTNQGRPPIAATTRAGDFRTGVVASRQAGGEYKAPPPNMTRGNGNEARPTNVPRPGEENRPAAENRPAVENHPENNNVPRPNNTYNHASEVQQHSFTPPPNTGNAKADQKFQQQQQKLEARQAADHQKLQQQQEKQHQQAAAQNFNDARKQQMEQRHTQQTQQMEQKHTVQQQHMEQRQAPRQQAPQQHDEKKR